MISILADLILINILVIVYEQSMLSPWIESIFDIFFAAMLKSEQLNVQEAAVTILSSFLDHGMYYFYCYF